MKKMLLIFQISLFCLFIVLPAVAAASPIIITGNEKMLKLDPFLYIMEDSSGSISIEEIVSKENKKLFKLNRAGTPDYGFNNKVYWVSFSITNESGSDKSLFLELAYPHMNKMEFHSFYQNGNRLDKITGDIYPFEKRDINYRNIVNELPVPENQTISCYIRFSGECSKKFPLILWTPAAFSEMVIEEKYILGIYYGIIIVMALYNLFLFFFVGDKSYLYYVIYICTYGLVQIAYNGMAFKYLWPSFPQWHNISLPFLIGLAVFWMLIFSKTFLHSREHSRLLDNILKGVIGTSVFAMLFSLFGSYLLAIKIAMLLMVISSAIIVTTGFIILKKGYRPARFFIIAWGAFLSGMILIAFNKLSIIESNFITEYAIQIGSALEVTLLSLALADRINVIDQEKKQAQAEKMKTQEKYIKLVEGSNEIIFSLDDSLNFTTVNRAMKEHLNINPESVIGKNFFDLLYKKDEEESMSSHFVSEKFDLLRKEKEPVSFTTEFKTAVGLEPKEMKISLEYLAAESESEILGKAFSIREDALLKYFTSEKQQFSIENFLLIADDITQRITRNLSKFIDIKESNILRIALREIIINAIEHGNLNISYEEKTDLLIHDNYFTFIASRREDPQYKNKKVHIEYSIDADSAVFKITDEGNGFDYSSFLNNGSNKANDEMNSHGRGLTMAKNVFDSIEFNKKGNQVLLIKYLNN